MATAALTSSNKARSQDPMVELNTTPLIDIMLVLLIMFIITIPPQSHQVAVKLPAATAGLFVAKLKNEVGLDVNGQARWNGTAVSDDQLRALLGEAAAMATQPEIHFRPDPAARYERVDAVMAIAAKSGVSHFGFVGNEGYRDIF